MVFWTMDICLDDITIQSDNIESNDDDDDIIVKRNSNSNNNRRCITDSDSDSD